jgi:DUF971 family protein
MSASFDDQSEYSGGVYSESKFKTDAVLKGFKDSFIYHWRYGHHADFGKDTLFHKPLASTLSI